MLEQKEDGATLGCLEIQQWQQLWKTAPLGIHLNAPYRDV